MARWVCWPSVAAAAAEDVHVYGSQALHSLQPLTEGSVCRVKALLMAAVAAGGISV